MAEVEAAVIKAGTAAEARAVEATEAEELLKALRQRAEALRRQALQLLRSEPLNVYRLARRLGLTYGGAQWLVFRLEREGLVRTYKVGGRRYVALSVQPPPLRVVDILEELARRAEEVLDMPVEEAAAELARRGDHALAEVLRAMARAIAED